MSERRFTFEIMEYLGVISSHNGWNKELNLISWNGGAPKYDIRDWDAYHERMSRGITLHEGEMRKIIDMYYAGKNKKAVEEGKAVEAERRERREEQRRSRQEQRRDPMLEEVEAEAFDGAIPPEDEAREEPEEAEEAKAMEDMEGAEVANISLIEDALEESAASDSENSF